jgi:hypothetical protein
LNVVINDLPEFKDFCEKTLLQLLNQEEVVPKSNIKNGESPKPRF